jgi:hypothetical protein
MFVNKFINKETFMGGWYIDDDVCDKIVSKSKSNPEKFSSGIRAYENVDLGTLDQDLNSMYCNSLYQVIEQYKEVFPWCFKELRPWGFTSPRLQRYNPGKVYNELHCENDGNSQVIYRHLVYMTYLHDIVDGGGTEFIHQNLITPAEKGLTLIWPAQWTHYHRGIVAPVDTKYILTGWCVFVDRP